MEYRKPTLTDVGITLMDFTGDGHREGVSRTKLCEEVVHTKRGASTFGC